MKYVTYTPPAGDPDFRRFTEQYGYTFEEGKAVPVKDEAHLRKFDGNPFFVVSDEAPKDEPKKDEGGGKKAPKDEPKPQA